MGLSSCEGLEDGIIKLRGLEYGGFVNATAWNPSSPASSVLNASRAVSHTEQDAGISSSKHI
jgi:hypothetical protein